MGLDTYAAVSLDQLELSAADQQAFTDADIHLCGGIFSAGESSFRGKIYCLLILDITGISLYEEWIPPETVQQMYAALARCDPEQALRESSERDRTTDEILELRKFFKVCSERSLGLVNWW